jgi:hypothetical protein
MADDYRLIELTISINVVNSINLPFFSFVLIFQSDVPRVSIQDTLLRNFYDDKPLTCIWTYYEIAFF